MSDFHAETLSRSLVIKDGGPCYPCSSIRDFALNHTIVILSALALMAALYIIHNQ